MQQCIKPILNTAVVCKIFYILYQCLKLEALFKNIQSLKAILYFEYMHEKTIFMHKNTKNMFITKFLEHSIINSPKMHRFFKFPNSFIHNFLLLLTEMWHNLKEYINCKYIGYIRYIYNCDTLLCKVLCILLRCNKGVKILIKNLFLQLWILSCNTLNR